MKIVLFALVLACALASSSLVQEFEAELPLEAQVDPEDDYIDSTIDFFRSFFYPATCDRSRTLYKQCDSAWKDTKIADKTICQVGCLMSSVSMALHSRGKSIDGKASNPGTLNAWLKTHGGYSGNLFVWGSVSPLGLRFSTHTTSHADIRNCLCDSGCEVILNVNSGGHYVLATGYDGSGYTVNDPGFSKTRYTTGEIYRASLFRA